MRPFTALIERKMADITREYERRLLIGFPVTLEGVDETLQLARDVDRTNWLTLLGICDELAAAGQGDAVLPVPVRCTSNRSYPMTAANCATMIRNLRAWGAAAQFNWWRLKDLAAAVERRTDLDLIDLSEGWP